MFRELAPLLRQRAVLLTLTHLEDDEIRVNVMPKQLAAGDNAALTIPFSLTGTAAELDDQLARAIVDFVAKHLEVKNTLESAKTEMDAAAKAAREEAKSKKASAKKPEPVSSKPEIKPEPVEPCPRLGLFDAAPTTAAVIPQTQTNDEDEILREIHDHERNTHEPEDTDPDDLEDGVVAA
jgi:PRTRC genetic system protein E